MATTNLLVEIEREKGLLGKFIVAVDHSASGVVG